jgi:type IV pilus biogenesis protein CpaD/CtpE
MIKVTGGQWVLTDDERRQLVQAVARWRAMAQELTVTFPEGSDAHRGARAAEHEAARLLELLRAAETQT